MLVHLDGFDSYTTTTVLGAIYSLYQAGSGTLLSTNGGRFGGGSVQYTALTNRLSKAIAPLTELWCGYAVNFSGLRSPGSVLWKFASLAGDEFCVTYIDGVVQVFRGTYSNTLVGTYYVPTISLNTWHWVECRYKYHASAGVAELWVDGVQFVSYSGNTTFAAGGNVNSINLSDSSRGFNGYTDDMYILDATQGANTTRLGDCRVGTLVPTSNASPNQATPSTGSAYTCVDEAQRNTTDYVTFTPYSAGMQEMYGMSSLPSVPSAIYGVRVLGVASKSDAGSASLKPEIVSGGSTGLGATQALSTSWADVSSIFETDPHTSAAWTTAAVNAMACGVQTV